MTMFSLQWIIFIKISGDDIVFFQMSQLKGIVVEHSILYLHTAHRTAILR